MKLVITFNYHLRSSRGHDDIDQLRIRHGHLHHRSLRGCEAHSPHAALGALMPTGLRLTGLISGVLLVPSYAASEAETLAPALVTALFNWLFAGGLEAAGGALMMLGAGAVTGVICGLIWARLSTSRL